MTVARVWLRVGDINVTSRIWIGVGVGINDADFKSIPLGYRVRGGSAGWVKRQHEGQAENVLEL